MKGLILGPKWKFSFETKNAFKIPSPSFHQCTSVSYFQLKVPYEVRGAQRILEPSVVSLIQQNSTTREYFLCLDNRPLRQLKGHFFSNEKSFFKQIEQNSANFTFLDISALSCFLGFLD